MASAIQVPVDVYLRTLDYEPDCEYVDGVIEERPMGQFDHSSWQQAIQRWFLAYRKEWNIYVRPELRVQVSATRYRVPDVTVFDRSRTIEQILTHPPIAVFEVLSPEDRMPQMLIKLADYERMGVRTIMLIDPPTGRISRFVGGQLEEIGSTVQELPGSLCSIDWRKVEELLD